MNTHADKSQEAKSPSVANEEPQKQSNGEATFQFVDNRNEAIAQRKLQVMANNSPRAMQLRAFQEMANHSPQVKHAAQLQAIADNYTSRRQQPTQEKENKTGLSDNSHPVFQRQVDLSIDTQKTAGNQYFIKTDNRHTLYGAEDVESPRPTGLFSKGADTDENLAPLQVWVPNASFIKDANKNAEGNLDETYPDTEMDVHGTEINKPGRQQYLKQILESIESPELRQGFSHPTLGIVGPNDCGKFALLLRQMIIAEGDAPGAPNEGGLAVGDQMTHEYQGNWDCSHHSATVVAVDGVDSVTLEAHAGQRQLTKPQLHIRQGTAGFAQDNRGIGPEARALGDNVNVNAEDQTANYLAESPGTLKQIADGIHMAAPLAKVDTKPPSNCYITTACVTSRSLPDDCEELTILRSFRDNYMVKIKGGKGLISSYYEEAPKIVEAINKRPDHAEIYNKLYNTIEGCVNAIKLGNPLFALENYKAMVHQLKEAYLKDQKSMQFQT